MFVGEIEFSDIPIDLENGLWPLGYIFLLGFIFLIGNNFIFSLTAPQTLPHIILRIFF